MMSYRKSVFLICLFYLFLTQIQASPQHNKAYKNFWHPAYTGARLDYCTLDGSQCGKAVANRYCRLLGYAYSNQSVIAYNVGLTHYLDNRARCTGWQCNGFMTIGCAMRMSHIPPKSYHYSEKKFADPRYNDFRVDWCYTLHKKCGSQAAHSFCKRLGFTRAKHYIKETQVGATKTLGTQELCFGSQCNGFKSIVCYR